MPNATDLGGSSPVAGLVHHETLMVVDVLRPGWVPFKNLAVSPEIPGWVRAHRVAMDYPWTILVGGHLGRLGTRADADIQRHYLPDLEHGAQATLATLDPTPSSPSTSRRATHGRSSRPTSPRGPRQVAEPSGPSTPEAGRGDVFTIDNALAMLESQRIDAGVLGPFGIQP